MEYKIIEGIKYLDEEWVNQHIDKEVTKVICHSTLKKIGPYAFNQRSNLKEIVLNEGLEEIGENAFYICGLKTLKLPDSLKFIRDDAFGRCYFLKEVQFGQELKAIGNSAFIDTSIREIVFPNSLLMIDNNASANCYELQRMVIPQGLSVIKPYAFYDCYNLEEVIVDDISKVSNFNSIWLNKLFGRNDNLVIKEATKSDESNPKVRKKIRR